MRARDDSALAAHRALRRARESTGVSGLHNKCAGLHDKRVG
jgi:hypothetical protein